MKTRIRLARRRWRWWGMSMACALAGVGFGAARWWHDGPKLPTAEARLGEFVNNFEIRGDLKTLRSITLAAPAVSGDLQIIKLAKNGSQVRSGDLVVQFDTTSLQRTSDQKRSEFKEN